jgi:catechol 2,3-dioxygenase-like lactoylglutathione lyase family enzyme
LIRGLVHVGITVLDFEKMLGFYRDVLGLAADAIVRHPRGGLKACLRGTDNETIEMISYPEPKPHQGRDLSRTGIHHFGFVVDDIQKDYERLERLGVEFDGGIKPNAKGDLVVHFWDPEGNRVHLTQLRSPTA